MGHLARHHPRDTDAAHTHHRPNGERLSRRQAVAVLRLAPFTEREIRTAVNTTVRLIETAPTKVPPPASSRLPESSKERSVGQRLPAPDGPRAIQEVNLRLSCRVRDVSTLGAQGGRPYKFQVDCY